LGKPGKCLEPGAFGAFPLENQNTPLLVFMHLGCSPRVGIAGFLIIAFSRLYWKLKNLAFIVWSDFEVIEPNSK